MTTYSAFFSSGLLAAPHMSSSHLMYNNHIPRHGDVSPSLLTITDALDDTSDIDLDRSSTPTLTSIETSMHQTQRLRRRRSSLTIGTSPINAIKSPSRAAGNALQLQRHLFTTPGRSRSGSTSSVMSIGEEVNSNIASENTSLYRRMRSGSVGSVLKSRRGVRRGVPGPSFPPPSAPLPALPPIPGTPSRTKAFSLAVPSIATQALAQKLAAAEDVLNLQVASSPTRQPFGDLQLHGYANDQKMRG
ncbi:hypothetical protein F5876DRAFT_81019 [Lentinula aff. lateritia]|uniref:Uncharacterized protein n=1 Tax=Lentinula aff. lateritia TaxID=2804960 RepID=A0ACC1TNR1_9AGAR|nr:hypothetical protein F5876DRAFT_81019 [Lentinula aff. lateritia]